MSKIAAIDTAIRLQIAKDGKSLSYSDKINATGGYEDNNAVEEFLISVAGRLRLDTPPMKFDWHGLDIARVQGRSMFIVHDLIEQHTRG
ncbi:ubiquitin family protein [Rhizobium ruizarguesonis]|uniref:hypothetical protein n=1 Tax=Rhizobium ruizarguesonis TaxID=2081791 RepID=UPI00103230DD|nr:hypothetical protein [Rhizobium ruizarguesonis]TBC84239.1 hypothetical protein ELH28_16355 [Rhizobium ruizarguesonis]